MFIIVKEERKKYMNIDMFNKGKSIILNNSLFHKELFNCADPDHILPLFTGLDDDLNIYLWCAACDYRKYIGLDTYQKIISVL